MLGYTFKNINLKKLNEGEFIKLREAIPKHGVICVKNQDFSPRELINFTKKFGDPVLLPEGLRFNNTQQEYPELTRVSNIRPNGELIPNHNAANYWHVDGDFWQPGENYIFNFLHALIVPEKGGETGFTDLRKAYEFLDNDLKKAIENLQIVSSCADIPDFKNAKPEELPPIAYHNIKHKHIETHQTGIYINYPTTRIDKLPIEESDKIMKELVKAIEFEDHQYIHKWEKGDILIWDNTSVMHKSMGGYGNHKRLLYRTQSFIQA